ncbi:rRNA pseudouridine synthase [Candidatus Peregrinibacteria bacterium]|nr:rRNA pseudouridine synthase [Candidatus Peregrinibacteria bacterium]
MEKIRINKFIAESGVCSRREADRLIQAGKVMINGKKAELGATVSEEDTITVNGKPINLQNEKIYIAFHKPFGVITTTDKNSENTVMDYIDLKTRVYPIGRLDVHSSGLLLLTNDGDIVNRILKSKHKLEKEYFVTLNKSITDEHVQKMCDGIDLDGQTTLPAKVSKINNRQIRMILIQGMNRQIRRMCEKLGYEIKILKRVRVGTITLEGLPRGKWRHLTKKEVASLATSS